MRTHIGLAAALLTMSFHTPLHAQRGGGARPMASHGTVRPMIPHAPAQRDPAHAEPMVEPGRPLSAVPYVRNNVWYGHAAPNDARFPLAHPFQAGRFGLTGPTHLYTVSRTDLGARRVWLPGGGFEIADWDWAVTAPWCWTCDDFVVYDDPDHPGWYLLYDVRLGEYVHATYLGA